MVTLEHRESKKRQYVVKHIFLRTENENLLLFCGRFLLT